MHQTIIYCHNKRHDKETSKVFTVNKVNLHNQQIELRDSDQLKDGVPPQRTMSENCILVFILLHDINYISVLPYEFHVVQLSYNAYVSLAVCLLFHEGKQNIFTNCSCSGSRRRDCNTFKKDLGLF